MVDLIKNEERILQYWTEQRILEMTRHKNKGKKVFYFLDGPPYVTGDLHPGHIWVKTLKDLFIRYKRYRGYEVVDRAGYDVHGLPIENKVEKELKIISKKEIETRVGVEEFIRECRKYVERYVGRMDADYERYGISLNFNDPYLPYTNGYMETAWMMFKKASERGFLYEGKKTLIYCPHCETPLSQGSMEVEYRDVDDASIFVAFKVDGSRSKAKIRLPDNTYLVIWTTTPWTLPANMAVAAHPDATYVMVQANSMHLILAKDRLENFSKLTDQSLAVLGEFDGKELEGLFYINPLEEKVGKQKEFRKYHKVVFAQELVSMEEGTGLVHIAPGHGAEDYIIGIKNKIPIFSPIGPDATYNDDAGQYKGLKVAAEANRAVTNDLEQLGVLLYKGSIRHSYPHCWRCATKLIFMATTQWFFNVQKMKKKLLNQNEKTNWHPEEVKNWQRDILTNSPDWCISRQRYWGIPMPIWRCASCGKTTIIGSISELKENAANPAEIDALSDLHRPYIDRIKVKCECGAQKERIKDILDVWFDSSSAFRASLTAEQFGKFSSPELIVEYVEQIRGWFQYMLKCSMMVYGKKPFNHIVVHGILFGLDGRKMSKSFGNYKPLSEMTKMVTADAFRLWCVNYNPILNRNLNEMEIKESEKAVVILHNISNLISEYQDAAGYTPKLRPKIKTKGLDELDLWIVSRTESLVEGVTNSLEHYEAFKAASAIKDFVIDDLSRFYLKLAKKRILYGDKKQAKTILDISYYVLYRALILSSIITPFIAESVYLDRYSAEREKSIFMERWPKPDTSKINRQLEEDMDIVKDTITALLSSREKADISLRWPIAKATVEVSDEERIAQLQKLAGIVEGAVNAKQIEVKKSEGLSEVVRPVFARLGPVFKDKANAVADALKSVDARELRSSLNGRGSFSLKTQSGEFEISPDQVSIIAAEAKGDAVIYKYGSAYVDREISKELREEALVREFERGIQVARKEMGLRKADKINVVYKAQEGISELIRNNSAKIKSDVGALSIQAAEIIEEQHFSKEFEIEDGKVTIGVERLRR